MTAPLPSPEEIRVQRKVQSKATRQMLTDFRRIARQPLSLSYSMPRTGSKTVTATVTNGWRAGNVIHLHTMAACGMARIQKLAEAGRREHVWHKQLELGLSTRALVEAKKVISRGSLASSEKIFVIAGVRDPIATHFSAMYEWFWHYVDEVSDYRPEFLASSFTGESWYRWADAWFDEELSEVFGIDYRDHPFPRERGFLVVETEGARVLIIRTESLGKLPQALAELYRMREGDFPVIRTNVTSDRAGGEHFASCLERVRISRESLASAYELPFAEHFYTATEREAFLEKWVGKIGQGRG